MDGNGLLTKIERSYHGPQNTYAYDDLYRPKRSESEYSNNGTAMSITETEI